MNEMNARKKRKKKHMRSGGSTDRPIYAQHSRDKA